MVLYTAWGENGDFTVRGARRAVGDSGWDRMTPVFALPSITTGAADWSPDGAAITYISGTRLLRADGDGRNPRGLTTLPADFAPFYARWARDGRLIYYSGQGTDGSYRFYAIPAAGGTPTEVAHSEGPTYQNYRFPFDVRGTTLYFSQADRQSDVWMAEVQRP